MLALGFGALGRACGPSVTGGVLSAVVGTPPVMLQSTCAVHAGSSGGPLLSARDGCLLGEPLSPLHPQSVPIALMPLVTSPSSRHRGQQRTGQHCRDHLPTPQLLHPHLLAAHTPCPLSQKREPCCLRPTQCCQQGGTGSMAAAAAAPQQAVTPPPELECFHKSPHLSHGVPGGGWGQRDVVAPQSGDRALGRGLEGPGMGMERSTQHGRLFHNTAAASTARTGGQGHGGDRWGGRVLVGWFFFCFFPIFFPIFVY